MYRGLILHTISKGMFVLGSYLMHFALGRNMSPFQYGIVGTIITIINFNYLFLQNGLRQGAANLIANGKYNQADIIKKGFIIQISIAAIIFIVNYAGSTTIASFLGDLNLEGYIKNAAWMIPFLGIYFACLGMLNGLRCFTIEAGITSIYPLLKLIVIPCALIWFDDSIKGTIFGFFIAGFIICIISIVALRLIRKRIKRIAATVSWKQYFKTVLGFSVVFIVTTILMNIDTMLLKAITLDDSTVGFYTGAVTFAKAPYYLLNAFYLVILPIVTMEYSRGDMGKCIKTISRLFTILCWTVLPIPLILGVSAESVLSLFYNSEYASASLQLIFLMISNTSLGIWVVLCMMISATGKKKFSAIMAIIMLGSDVICCYIFTKLFGANGTACAGALITTLGMIVSGTMVIHIFGNFLSKKLFALGGVYVLLGLLFRNFFVFVKVDSLPILILIYIAFYSISLIIAVLLRLVPIKDILKKLIQ